MAPSSSASQPAHLMLTERAHPAGGKLILATVGDSPTKASEVAVLTVDGPEQLLSAQPTQWEVLRKASKEEVSLRCADGLAAGHLTATAIERPRGFWSYRQVRMCTYVIYSASPVCIESSSMLPSKLCIRMH